MQNNMLKTLVGCVLAIMYSFNHAATIDPNSLYPVAPDVKCVEYYNFNGKLYCSTVAQSSEPADASLKDAEKLNIVFDKRAWKLAWGKTDESQTTIEYIPINDNIDQWSELITSQFFKKSNDSISPLQFAQSELQQLDSQGFKIKSNFIQKSPTKLIFEYQVLEPVEQQQDELQMIMTDAQGLYVLHYVIKKADMGQAQREKWIHNLDASRVK